MDFTVHGQDWQGYGKGGQTFAYSSRPGPPAPPPCGYLWPRLFELDRVSCHRDKIAAPLASDEEIIVERCFFARLVEEQFARPEPSVGHEGFQAGYNSIPWCERDDSPTTGQRPRF